jgi:RNA polymerase sigma-70 factor, ECF subfamily
VKFVTNLHLVFKALLVLKQLFKTRIEHIEDSVLLERVVQDSDHAVILTEWYQRYAHLVFGVCLKYLKNKEDAEDLTLSIFSVLIERAIKSDIKNFKSWLYTLTKNECLMKLRKRSYSFYDVGLLKNLTFEEETTDVETDFYLSHLVHAIQSLNDTQQEIIRLFYLEKMSYEDIQKITGSDFKTVKSNIQNGKRNLKIFLQKKLAKQ